MLLHNWDPYSFERLILPPLYLFDDDTTRAMVPSSTSLGKEDPLTDKDQLFCRKPVSDADETVCTQSTSETSSLSSVYTKSKRRRVRFHQNEAGQVIVTAHPPVTHDEEPVLREVVWYRTRDFKYFRKQGKQMATIAAASAYGKDLRKAAQACAKGKNSVNHHKYSKIANSSVRGLEIMVDTELMRDRKSLIQSVLKAQAKLAASTKEMPYEQRQEILRATSVILSRKTRILAQVLAHGDAKVAASHAETSETEAVKE